MFARNIEKKGRVLRLMWAVLFFIGAGLVFGVSKWVALLLAAGGLFTLFEALRGWCLLRACGIKTKH